MSVKALFIIATLTLALPCTAKEVSKSFSLGSFNEVEAGGHFEIEITAGAKQEITLFADSDDLSMIDVTVSDETLILKTKRRGLLWGATPGSVKVVIKTPTLDAVDISGAGKLNLMNLKSKEFSLAISGAATAALAGNVEMLEIDISGSGKVRAFNLEAKVVKADVSGAGDVEVYATKIIDANVSGVGKLVYKGSPAKVTSSVSGVGNIKPRG